MQRIASLLILMLMLGALHGEADQPKLRGQVVNRDGVAQQCQVSFFRGKEVAARVATDRQGYFVVGLAGGKYRVVVVQGRRQAEFDPVTIDAYGLHPSTFVVQW